jgi:hypothetical protein
MTFKVTWTLPDGNRDGFEGKTAKDTLREIGERGLAEAPGLQIKDAGGVSLRLDPLAILAAQQVAS